MAECHYWGPEPTEEDPNAGAWWSDHGPLFGDNEPTTERLTDPFCPYCGSPLPATGEEKPSYAVVTRALEMASDWLQDKGVFLRAMPELIEMAQEEMDAEAELASPAGGDPQ